MDINNYKNAFKNLYGTDPLILEEQTNRYQRLDKEFLKHYKKQERFFFSSPGRTELCGNHTDHNNGRVLAASIDLDSIAVAAKNSSQRIVLYSEGYKTHFEVDLSDSEPKIAEQGITTALVRGITSRLSQLGYKTGGFNACMTSNIASGSGLSSSASVEVLIATIFNHLFNSGRIPPLVIAQTGQYSEKLYFGKPCGLMDQIACTIGGIVAIDFKDSQKPQIERVEIDFKTHGYSLIIVDTGGSHADLTGEYASIPQEMRQVAEYFDKTVLREIGEDQFANSISTLRESVGDRAVLRAMHFFAENKRVALQVEKLRDKDFLGFLGLLFESGRSSARWLQNIYSTKDIRDQGVTMALALTEKYIIEIGAGACRVHGGGFAGTIQVFIPVKDANDYIAMIENVFGKGSAITIKIRNAGAKILHES